MLIPETDRRPPNDRPPNDGPPLDRPRRLDRPPLEMWGGIECTVNRVGDRYHDQLDRNGHGVRCADLDLFASLGIKALRYPLLWERIAPRGLRSAEWTWADERMGRLRDLGLRPIVGLVHHGSGPRHTSLLEESFVDGLAEFAGEVARRYPWVQDFTPVNEPLTTARFSALYGFWYPHRRDLRSFVRALLVQCRAVGAAMQAIRSRTPGARLVQTEDFGRTFSTRVLAAQARYENDRRLLSLDLLSGRVRPDHPLWAHLLEAGARPEELEWLGTQPPPDVIGVNYYLTSDRLLDPRLARYPACTHGGNGRQSYADVEAVRASTRGIYGHAAILRQLHRRYRLPLAITEVHAGATREEQLRWLQEAWDAAESARAEGADVRAVTAWSLLGSWDWDVQVTCEPGHYEPGVFDLRGGCPRPTAIAHLVRDLAAGRPHRHPVLDAPGWWRRPARLLYPPVGPRIEFPETAPARAPGPLLISGGGGTLAQALTRACQDRGLAHRVLDRAQLDVADARNVAEVLDRERPWAVVNAAGYVRVDAAESNVARCHRANALGPAVLAAACEGRGVQLLTFSSDLVFDGIRRRPYMESAPVAPLGVYGVSKARGEAAVAARMPSALIVRTSAFFGPWDAHNFLAAMERTLAREEPFPAASDMIVSPTYVPDLVEASLDLLVDGERGIWHLASPGALSWAQFARMGAALAGLDPRLVTACTTRELSLPAPRPAYSALGSERGALLPALEDSLSRWARDRAPLARAG
jgi:dTDP-4-dehydrorhamnose reductase